MVPVFSNPLIVPELFFHVICHSFETLLVLKPEFLLEKILFVRKLPPQLRSLLFEHLSEALLHETPIVGKLLLPLQLELLKLALGTDNNWYIMRSSLCEPTGRGARAGRSWLLRGHMCMSATASNMTVAMHTINVFCVKSASGSSCGLFPTHLATER